MLREKLCVVAALLFLPALMPGPARAAGPSLSCVPYADTTICSGTATSFDGTPLDLDLTLPTTQGTTHPLMVMLHGFGNDKHEWESNTDAADSADKWHWNTHWFATHGYYVLTYTARGFGTSTASKPWQPATPAGTSASLPNGTIHLKSREFEARDTRWLAAQMAAVHPDLDRDRVAVSGGSYGGGESWLLASQPVWAEPGLPALHLRVAVPKYPWTDLAYSLAPNGHPGYETGNPLYSSAQGRPGDREAMGAPVGVPKASYVSGFYVIGSGPGNLFEVGTTTTPSQETTQDGPMNVPAWNARLIGTGDPYDVNGVEDAVVRQVRRGLTVFRGSYYQVDAWRAAAQAGNEVAVYSISGWTDNLFPAVESFRQLKQLLAIDPAWPVEVAVADVGHPLAQNPPAVWQALNTQANSFLAVHISGGSASRPTVTSFPTLCGGASTAAVTASTPEGLAQGALQVQFADGGSITSTSGVGDPDGVATDPALVSQTGAPGCRTSVAALWPGRYTGVSAPLGSSLTVAGIGWVRAGYTMSGGPDASLDARVWDVAPDGNAVLVTRGAYRIDTPAYDPASGTVTVPLFGNHWALPAGHRLRLDLTQADTPAFRQSTAVSALRLEAPVLVLPTVEAGQVTLSGE